MEPTRTEMALELARLYMFGPDDIREKLAKEFANLDDEGKKVMSYAIAVVIAERQLGPLNRT